MALVGTLGLAACGDEDAKVTAESADLSASDAARAAVGSDRHLVNWAAEMAQRAREAGTEGVAETESGPNVFEAGNRAAAAWLARQASG